MVEKTKTKCLFTVFCKSKEEGCTITVLDSYFSHLAQWSAYLFINSCHPWWLISPWRSKHMLSLHSSPETPGFWSKLIPSWRMTIMNGLGGRDGWASHSSALPPLLPVTRCWGLSYFSEREKNVALYSSSGDSLHGAGRAAVLTDLEQKDTQRKSTNRDDDVELWTCEFGCFTLIISLLRHGCLVFRESLLCCVDIWVVCHLFRQRKSPDIQPECCAATSLVKSVYLSVKRLAYFTVIDYWKPITFGV